MTRSHADKIVKDSFLISLARFLRGLGGGALSVVLATTLAQSGEPPWLVGAMVGAAIGGASLWSIAAPSIERTLGRRRTFILAALLFSAGGSLLFLDLGQPIIVGLAALLGGLLVSTSDLSPLAVLEQATLANASEPRKMTRNFSLYNLVGYVGVAVGTLVAAPLLTFAPMPQWLPNSPRNGVLLLYTLVGLVIIPLYGWLSRGFLHLGRPERPRLLSPESRRKVLTLSLLFSVDAFGGGLIANTLVAWWLEFHYAATPLGAGLVLFFSAVASGISLLLATPLSSRLGLVRTMVFTHIPSSVLLISFPFAPTLLAAGGIWVGRAMLSQVDVPTRQSFTQAIVRPEERGAAAGYTTAARSTSALGAPLTGSLWSAGGAWLSLPFVVGGTVKILYDVVLYERFRDLLPPGEHPRVNSKEEKG